MNRVVIIGGGASGLTAAIWAAREGAAVTVLEQNGKPAKKILATGNGRCNLTNIQQEPSCYRCSDPRFPWKIIEQFPVSDTIRFFSQLGIYTRNRNGWMYPYSDQASSVARVLEMEAAYRKVKIKTNQKVCHIWKANGEFLVETDGWQYTCDRVIIACGGCASQVEGSSDSGYRLAEELGHTVIPPMPALVPLKCSGNYFSRWAGVRMEGTVSLEIEGHVFFRERGELLFTDYGISGIPVFQISRYAVRACREGNQVCCRLDLMPDLTLGELTALLNSRKESCPYKSVRELLLGLVPEKMIPVLVPEAATLAEAAGNLKDWTVNVKDGHSFRQAQVCSGGVSTREMTENMESRLVDGLYFAGEVADVDGPCGGYNLQWAWSSGAVAGRAAARKGGRDV